MSVTGGQKIHVEELANAKALGQGLVWSRNSRRQEWPEQKWDQGADGAGG